jgi:integration host factor subunit beta
MIKSELIERISTRMPHLTEEQTTEGVNLILDLIADSMMRGQRIEIRGFGSFSLRYRAPRKAHNPKTGAIVLTEAKHSPHFKPGKELRDRVNEAASTCPITDD